ncbi:MAG: amino acid ABC transporter permease [Armatimonadota bacterium]|nr:amino acid ABC transporter permease [Armatimonadota bacterium]MDR5689779.1 amino acid ABC transporter permease [Armatimonadota bacterium]MDR7388635.1 amino acid ABC transporter permease [Armatimonadota bacterium]MDR7391542.1 amino acid ABC transporter permease [Armatimonadota bacterium]MDR7393298.1 amino acid ABC transporter permease [Armatimonadota bacterium]
MPGPAQFWVDALPALLRGALLTLQVSALAIALAAAVGVGVAAARTAPLPPLRWLGAAYVEVFRNTPLLVQIFFVFFGLPRVGLRLSPFQSGLLALSLYTAAYNAEVFRAGLEAVPRGLREAAAALGLSGWQRFRHVVLPVAARISLPALGNNFVALVKNSSLVSAIGMVELTFVARDLEAWTFRSFEVYGMATLLYLALVLLLVWALRNVESRALAYLRVGER